MRVLDEPEHEAGIDAARARRHDEAFERREAHRRLDRAPAGDGGERGAGAEVAGHDAQNPRRGRAGARVRRQWRSTY